MSKAKKTAFLGICVALSMMLSYIDSQIPLFPSLPGIRLGLANTVTVFFIYKISAAKAAYVTFIRVALCGILFYGNAYHIAYGLCGAMLSILVMLLLKRTGAFSITGVSIAGGVSHNIGQILCAVAMTMTPQIILYLPPLLICGCLCGAGIGAVSALLIRRIEKGGR